MQRTLEDTIKRRHEALVQIGDNMQGFSEEKAKDDPARIQVLFAGLMWG